MTIRAVRNTAQRGGGNRGNSVDVVEGVIRNLRFRSESYGFCVRNFYATPTS